MCDFADSLLYGRYGAVPGAFPPPRQSDFYYAAHDSLYFAHQFRDVSTYFTAVSGGRTTVRCDVVAEVANLPLPMGWYGDHPDEGEQPVVLARDVVTALDPLVDFSRYDTVILVHAGAGEETDILDDSPEQIYSTYLSPEDFAAAADDSILAGPYLLTDDFDDALQPVRLDQVLVLPETEFQDPYAGFGGYFGSLGVYCFEIGLRLGMLSLSDFTPAGSPDSQGVGEFDLMGYGLFVGAGFIPCHPSAFNKLLMGWVSPYTVEPGSAGRFRLDPIETAAGDSLLARVEIVGREYWLLEYRLQDPDGNRIFSFAGDLNGNNIPDFYDADSQFGDGRPTGLFDPAADTREWLTGAEWDFFMSENTARAPGVKGAGSGVYVWHVDEGVIEQAVGADTNLFNADPRRKSVDLEEADGIQDLDSRQPSPFMLGGDHDSFRGEDNARFGPDTNPDTRSAGGAWTGIRIEDFSNVVADSSVSAGGGTVIGYADRMHFRCARESTVPGTTARAVAERALASVDPAGSHLLAVDLDATPDGAREIVFAADGGLVLAFKADLTEQHDGDGDPGTTGILARGLQAAGDPALWNQPPAAGDLDGDGRPEVVLTAADGLYAFRGTNGAPLPGDGAGRLALGRVRGLAACDLPPVLLRRDGGTGYEAAAHVMACVIEKRTGPTDARLLFLGATGEEVLPGLSLGAVLVPALPVPVAPDLLAVVCLDPVSAESGIRLVRWGATSPTPVVAAVLPLAYAPGRLPPAVVTAAGRTGLVVADETGRAEVCWWGADLRLEAGSVWPEAAVVTAPLSVGFGNLAATAGSRASLWTSQGAPATGWPRGLGGSDDSAAGSAAPAALIWSEGTGWTRAERAGILGPDGRLLYTSRDGRLFLFDEAGRLASGWPLAGPGNAAGTPVLLDLADDGKAELVALGAFARITGRDDRTGAVETEPLARLAVWSVALAGDPVWPMWQQNPWRAPAPPSPLAGEGQSFRPESLVCYPSPFTGGVLRVRAFYVGDCEARAVLYDLAGEEVASAGPIGMLAGGPGEIPLPLGKIASGMYVCRLTARARDGSASTAVAPIAVAR